MRAQTTGFTLLLVLAASPALALGPSYGVRVGTGPGFGSGSDAVEDTNFTSLSLGPAAQFDLAVVAFEVDLLYTRLIATSGPTEVIAHELDLPIIATLGIPIVPKLLTAKVGAGVQPRFRLSATLDGETIEDDETESMVMYVPINVGARIGAGVLSFGIDMRYLYQLTPAIKDSDDRVNHLMFFGGLFF